MPEVEATIPVKPTSYKTRVTTTVDAAATATTTATATQPLEADSGVRTDSAPDSASKAETVFACGDTTGELSLTSADRLSEDTAKIVSKALEGGSLSRAELLQICRIAPHSADYYHLKWATRHMNFRAAEGIAEVHAQIGVDANPCSRNCRYCSFAAVSGIRRQAFELPISKIVEHAQTFEADGANCLTVMSTADYDFDKYLDVIRAIRANVSPELPIMANIGDFDYTQALRLKAAGVGSWISVPGTPGENDERYPRGQKRDQETRSEDETRRQHVHHCTGVQPDLRGSGHTGIREQAARSGLCPDQ
jgi:hypothetical protein